MKAFMTILAVAALLATAAAPAHAGPISSDLDITGEIYFDEDYAAFDSTDPTAGGTRGDVTQSGDYGVVEGGSATLSGYTGDSVDAGDDAAVGGAFTDFGDGFCIDGSSSGTHDGTDLAEFLVGIDFFFDIYNDSSDDWTVTFKVSLMESFANADGTEAAAESEIWVEDPFGEVFYSDLLSDTDDGDLDGYDALTSYGGDLSEGPTTYYFDVDVAAGLTESVYGAWTLSGEALTASDFIEGGLDFKITIDSATVSVVPLPPAGFAGLAMLAGIFGLRRLRRTRS